MPARELSEWKAFFRVEQGEMKAEAAKLKAEAGMQSLKQNQPLVKS